MSDTERIVDDSFSGPCPLSILLKAMGVQNEIEKCLYRTTNKGTLKFSSRIGNGFINDREICLKIIEAFKGSKT